MSVDVEAVRRGADIVDVISRYVQLNKRGAEFVGLCPFHPDSDPSLNVHPGKQVWACFSCGAHEAGADVFGFVMKYEDCTFPQALEKLSNGQALPDAKPIQRPALKRPSPREMLIPPDDSKPEWHRRDFGMPVKVWTICAPDGKPWFYEARYLVDGVKETRFYTWGRYSEQDPPRWECKHPPNPRPFFGLEQLAAKPDAQVIIHEAPKKAEAGARLFPAQVHLGMIGGAHQLANMDLAPLAGRKVILLPDNDEAGKQAMKRLAARLVQELGLQVKGIDPDTLPDGTAAPEGWDIADAPDWTPKQALAWAKARTQVYEAPVAGPLGGPPSASPAPESSPNAPDQAQSAPQEVSPTTPDKPAIAKPRLSVVEGNTLRAVELDPVGLLRDSKGILKPCESSAFALINAAPQYAGLHWDDFLCRSRLGTRDWSDHDDRDTLCWLQAAHQAPGFTLGQARNALQSLAYARRRDSLQEFVLNLPEWDKTERIEHAFIDAWGAEDSALVRAASRNFFIALHARAVKPGAQVDNLWVIEGPQGQLKSMSLRILGGEFHAEISAPVGTADFLRELRSLWIAEMSELDSLRGREASTVKRILSAPSDRFVDKYDRHPKAYPRRAVVVATTNEANYWQDSTGARRLIPIRAGTIRPDLIESTRLQWFAEARVRFDAGETWWAWPDSTEAEQDARQIVDPWEDTLRESMRSPSWPVGWVTSAAIMIDWLKLDASQQGSGVGMRLGRVMRRLGYVAVRKGAPQVRGWMPLEREAHSPCV